MTTYPINEIFGPTLQGEGYQLGQITHFVRFAGCNFDCLWCDTRYAVNPKYEGWKVTSMTSKEIVDVLNTLPGHAGWVTLSGGNPTLFVTEELITTLHLAGYQVAIETQWIPKYSEVFINIDHLVYSPKPPSSGMSTRYDREQWDIAAGTLIDRHIRKGKGATSVKTVIFNARDLAWTKDVEQKITERTLMEEKWVPLILSVGTPRQPDNLDDLRQEVVDRTLFLLNLVNQDPYFKNHRITPQLHAMIWGRRKGV